MPEVGDDIDDADRVAALADRHRDAWQRTLDDTEALAERRAADGWETLVIPAGDTAPEPPDAGDTDRFGLAHVVPGNFADDFEELTDDDPGFGSYDVYRADNDGRVFVTTELMDEERGLAVYVVGTYELRHAGDLIQTAVDRRRMYTHLQRLDGTRVASIVHEDPEKFFPNVDRFVDSDDEGETSETGGT
ncbi:MAG: hypothetical protein J07HB67_02711 [halophilic archaeon J07HB67]|jgi:hypothetical protein|nr:MAG: hypothetical protein J07HB67_02711 [halophilic archaeon J07HB67]